MYRYGQAMCAFSCYTQLSKSLSFSSNGIVVAFVEIWLVKFGLGAASGKQQANRGGPCSSSFFRGRRAATTLAICPANVSAIAFCDPAFPASSVSLFLCRIGVWRSNSLRLFHNYHRFLARGHTPLRLTTTSSDDRTKCDEPMVIG